ncbi:MAG: hypothetical protein GX774_18360 [Armatimonadetes bacterium]|jgi:hypothetical protein|nr:hypothetical protein [Armatimonadota bacterium]
MHSKKGSKVPEHGNIGESKKPTTIGIGHIGETPETEMNVGGGTRTIRIDDEVSQIAAGEPGLRTTSPPGGVSVEEEEEISEEEF